METFYIWTIGCQMNLADSWRLEQELRRLGYREAPRADQADIVVLNTCVVRQHAEDKCIGRITSLQGWKRRHPHSLLVVMGCFVADDIQHVYPHVDLFIKPSATMDLVDYLCDNDLLPTEPIAHPSVVATRRIADSAGAAMGSAGLVPVSVYMPISFGCDRRCTYCIVRLRRGPERSRPIPEIVHEAASLVQRGAREIVLLGQNVDSYNPSLVDLLHAIHEIEGLQRIRFLTSHPADMQPAIIEAVAALPRVCPHFELPIQSGDDQVLQRMGRGYTVSQYVDLVAHIRERFPGRVLDSCRQIPTCSIATDVIVGFPGESQAQYEATYSLLEKLRFDAVHVAAYSERPGTPAARLPDDVPSEEKERRRQAIDELQARIVGEINARFLGETVEVLVEARRKGRWQGRTVTNKLVHLKDKGHDWQGKLAQVCITWTGPWSMIGHVKSD